MALSKTAAVALLVLRSVNGACDWDYAENGEDWADNSEYQCSTNKQSPIDVVSSNVEPELDTETGIESLQAITVETDASGDTITFTMENNGHTINLYPDSDVSFTFTGGNLGDKEFCLFQFHLHWGDSDETGTEHYIDGDVFALDSHFVWFDCENGNVTQAGNVATVNYGGGIDAYQFAVTNLIFEVTDNDDEDAADLSAVIDALDSISESGETTDIELDSELFGLIGTHEDYYSYLGGLTTPGCFEIVRWHIIKQRLKVKKSDLAALRGSLNDCNGDTLTKNWRVLAENVNPLWSYCTDESLIGDDEECTVDNTDSVATPTMLMSWLMMVMLSMIMA